MRREIFANCGVRIASSTFIGFLLAFLAAKFFYEELIVPRLPEYLKVPAYWWFLITTPIWVVSLVSGWKGKRFQLVIFVSICGAISYIVAVLLSGHGFHDIEYGSFQHYMEFLVSAMSVFVVIFLLVSIGWGAQKLLVRDLVFNMETNDEKIGFDLFLDWT